MFSEEFLKILKSAKSVVAITGAGISAESGVPTFRGAGGLWRKYEGNTSNTYIEWARIETECIAISYFTGITKCVSSESITCLGILSLQKICCREGKTKSRPLCISENGRNSYQAK